MRTWIEKNEWLVVTSLFLLITGVLFRLASTINGPYIFGDEPEYHWLASEIYHYWKFYGHQYNPLYPLLIAPTFYISDLATHFYAIKLLNMAVYVSIIFPAYLIGRKVLTCKSYAILLAFVAALAPIGAYSHMVWADPLYYTLICWGYYFFIRYLMHEKLKDIFYTGVFIGLGFLAKQAALFFLSSILVYAIYAAFSGIKKFDRKAFALLTVGAALIVLPWLVRNTFFGESALGYSSMFSLFFETLKNNPQHFVREFILGMGYSVGYWIFVYFGAGFFLLLFAAFNKDSWSENDHSVVSTLAKIVLIHSFFLMVLSELLIVPYGNPPMVTGRYIDVISPVAIIVIAWMVLRQERFKFDRGFIIGSAVACFVLLLLFSPLTQVKAFGVTTNSGVSILNFFWSEFLWDSPQLSLFNKLTLAVVLTTLLVVILVLRKNVVWIICLCSLLLGVGAHWQAIRLGSMANPINQIFIELDKRYISIDKVAIDTALQGVQFPFYMKFWHPTNSSALKFIDPINLVGKVSIDFGLQGNKAGNSEWKIWAPWNPESGYNENVGLGFNDISTLQASKCAALSEQGDFVYDNKPLEFNLHLPSGDYILRGKSADTRCLGIESSFIVQAQGGGSARLHHNAEFILPFEVGIEGRGLKMSLKPSVGFVWALDKISIEPQNKELSQDSVPQSQFVLTKKLLPLPQFFNVDVYRLYKAQLTL